MKCENCLEYDRCEIIWKLKELVGRYKSEKEEIKQPKLTDEFTDVIQKCMEEQIALDRRHMKELKEILKKQDKCFFRRLHLAEKLGYRLFRSQSRPLPIDQSIMRIKKEN